MILDIGNGESWNTHTDKVGVSGDDEQSGNAGERVEERHLALTVTQQQFYGLHVVMGLPRGQFGRFKGDPDETRQIHLDDGEHSCMGRLDKAIAYADRLGLPYELSVTTVRQGAGWATGEQPPKWSEIHPGGAWVYYRGDAPSMFSKVIRDEFGFNPAASPDWESSAGYGFHCPAEHLDAIYGSKRWPLIVI